MARNSSRTEWRKRLAISIDRQGGVVSRGGVVRHGGVAGRGEVVSRGENVRQRRSCEQGGVVKQRGSCEVRRRCRQRRSCEQARSEAVLVGNVSAGCSPQIVAPDPTHQTLRRAARATRTGSGGYRPSHGRRRPPPRPRQRDHGRDHSPHTRMGGTDRVCLESIPDVSAVAQRNAED